MPLALLFVLFALFVFDVVELLFVLEPLVLELSDELPVPELVEPPVVVLLEPPVVVLLEPEPELLLELEPLPVPVPELPFELELPESEDVPDPLVDESVVLLVVSELELELESAFSVDSDAVGFSD